MHYIIYILTTLLCTRKTLKFPVKFWTGGWHPFCISKIGNTMEGGKEITIYLYVHKLFSRNPFCCYYRILSTGQLPILVILSFLIMHSALKLILGDNKNIFPV